MQTSTPGKGRKTKITETTTIELGVKTYRAKQMGNVNDGGPEIVVEFALSLQEIPNTLVIETETIGTGAPQYKSRFEFETG